MAYEAAQTRDGQHVAGADLSAKQYTFVKLNSSGAVVAAVAADKPYGILQNAPKSGEAATVCIGGISKVKSAGTIANGATIGSDANGAAVSSPTTASGVAQLAGASGDVITVRFIATA